MSVKHANARAIRRKTAGIRRNRKNHRARTRKGAYSILHRVQETYGHLPLEVQKFIADFLNKSLAEVSESLSIRSFHQAAKDTIRVWSRTACCVSGRKIVERLREILGVDIGETTEDGRLRLRGARSLRTAPAMMIDDTVYKQVNVNMLENILPYGGAFMSIEKFYIRDLEKIKSYNDETANRISFYWRRRCISSGSPEVLKAVCDEISVGYRR